MKNEEEDDDDDSDWTRKERKFNIGEEERKSWMIE